MSLHTTVSPHDKKESTFMRILPLAALLVAAAPAIAPAADCKISQEAMTTETKRLTDDLNAKIAAQQKSLNAAAATWKNDLPDPDKHPETTIDFYFDVKSHNQDIILNLPEVTVKQQQWVLKLPEIAVKQQKWIWDRPDVVMVLRKTGQYPEFRCRNVKNMFGIELPECYTEWHDIMTNVPEVHMNRTETILGVPEFAMRDQTMILGVPEFSMREQKIVVTIPDFTLKKVSVETKKIKDEATAASDHTKQSIDGLTQTYHAQIERLGATQIAAVYGCQRTELAKQQEAALAQIDTNIATVETSLRAANDNGATEFAASMQKTLSQLRQSRQAVIEQFAKAFDSMNKAERTMLAGGIPVPPSNPAAKEKPRVFRFAFLKPDALD